MLYQNLTPMASANLIESFCILDEFYKYFAHELKKHMVDVPDKRRRNRSSRLSVSEVMAILHLVINDKGRSNHG